MENLEFNLLQSIYSGRHPRELSPLVLAYVGDAVFEIMVRMTVLNQGNAPVNTLHKKARQIVNAKSQAEFYFRIEPLLTDQEKAVFKRGRNAKSFTVPKNAVLIDYKHATGLEAVFGFLFLDGNMNRLYELYNQGLNVQKKEN